MIQLRWFIGMAGVLGVFAACCNGSDQLKPFHAAQPVWAAGRETEMNLAIGFRADFTSQAHQPVTLRLACSTVYRAWINNHFIAYGPARGPHGYYRVDELSLTPYLRDGKNTVAIEVVGYNVNSYDTLDQPSFLQAEITNGDKLLAATAAENTSFHATLLTERVQKVQRYSFQRPFIEVYRLSPGCDQWRAAKQPMADSEVVISRVASKQLLPRRVPLPQFEVRQPVRVVSRGRVTKQVPAKPLWKDRSLVNISSKLKGYPERELAVIPSIELQQYASVQTAAVDQPYQPGAKLTLSQGTYQIVDLGVNVTGMPGARVTCKTPCRLWLAFDEILSGDDVDFKRLGCVNVISYNLQPGEYKVESLEPYTLRYLKLICVTGACDVTYIHLREYKHPQPQVAKFSCRDERLNRIYAAGIETYRQNAVDIFMDCPSRERAGWLCDSFFTARVAHDVTGTTQVEKNFFENFLLPDHFEYLPAGMLPMCYPADHNDGVFIPNWSLWFVVQLEEYLQRSGDKAMVDALRGKVLRLFDYFKPFENEDGLLEKLDGWVFVEWSDANKYVQDVNYPSNMLYAGALSAAARLYGVKELEQKADRIRQMIRQQSLDGTFFVDNAMRKNGKLQVTRNRTEVCQYFAFFFGVATLKTHAPLWETLRGEFGPDRKQTKAHSDVGFANSFIGNMLRFELLSQNGCGQQILDESSAYLLFMAERTGTLWEHDRPEASCDHGFASHIVHTLFRDVLGITHIDVNQRRVTARFSVLRLQQCSGTLPTVDGPVSLRWRQQGNQISYHVDMPQGYRVDIENLSGKKLIEQ